MSPVTQCWYKVCAVLLSKKGKGKGFP